MWQFITEYWAGWLCALIGGAILAAIPKIKALWDAVLALLHDRIYTECYRFMELGYITRDGLRYQYRYDELFPFRSFCHSFSPYLVFWFYSYNIQRRGEKNSPRRFKSLL